MAACAALAESRQWSTTDSLLPLLEDQVLLVRVASAQALGKIGNPAAIAALDKALRALSISIEVRACGSVRISWKHWLRFAIKRRILHFYMP